MTATGVFEEIRLGVRPAMSMAIESNPNRHFLFLKVADLITAKITWAWPKIKGDATPYNMDKFMKYLLVYFVQVFILHYGGFKVLKYSLAASSSIL
jgi:lipocalin